MHPLFHLFGFCYFCCCCTNIFGSGMGVLDELILYNIDFLDSRKLSHNCIHCLGVLSMVSVETPQQNWLVGFEKQRAYGSWVIYKIMRCKQISCWLNSDDFRLLSGICNIFCEDLLNSKIIWMQLKSIKFRKCSVKVEQGRAFFAKIY